MSEYDDALNLAGHLNAVVTVTDGDGDTAAASTDIGDQIVFEDDGPTAAIVGTENMATLDESLRR